MRLTKRTKISFPTYPDVDSLIRWLQHANAAHLPVNDTLLREKLSFHYSWAMKNLSVAKAGCPGLTTATTSRSWQCGQSRSVYTSVVEHCKTSTLALLLQQYVEDVCNLAEAALLYKMLPTKTFAPKGAVISEKTTQGQNNRCSAQICPAAKFPLLIIGKWRSLGASRMYCSLLRMTCSTKIKGIDDGCTIRGVCAAP